VAVAVARRQLCASKRAQTSGGTSIEVRKAQSRINCSCFVIESCFTCNRVFCLRSFCNATSTCSVYSGAASAKRFKLLVLACMSHLTETKCNVSCKRSNSLHFSLLRRCARRAF
jgi:hypothetical protein